MPQLTLAQTPATTHPRELPRVARADALPAAALAPRNEVLARHAGTRWYVVGLGQESSHAA